MSDTPTGAGDPSTTPAAVVEPTKGEAPKTFDETYVQSLRAESADWRTKLRAKEQEAEELRAKVTEFERSQMAETDRIKAELEDLKNQAKSLASQNKATQLEAAVAKNLVKFELADVDAAIKLLDKSSVNYGSDNRPTNIEDVLSQTLEKYPFLKVQSSAAPPRPATPDPGATNPGRESSGALTMEAVRNMSPGERLSRLEEIRKFAANGYK